MRPPAMSKSTPTDAGDAASIRADAEQSASSEAEADAGADVSGADVSGARPKSNKRTRLRLVAVVVLLLPTLSQNATTMKHCSWPQAQQQHCALRNSNMVTLRLKMYAGLALSVPTLRFWPLLPTHHTKHWVTWLPQWKRTSIALTLVVVALSVDRTT